MYTYLQEREYYENLYDRMTVAYARRSQYYYDDLTAQLAKKVRQLDPSDDLSSPGNALVMNVAYMELCGDELLSRYEQREPTIEEWMERDRARDQRIANTKLKHEPPCQHCGQLGMKCNYKTLMRRDENEELVLLFFRCDSCHKSSCYWEDGAPYEIKVRDDPEDFEEIDNPNPPKKKSSKKPDIKDINDPYFWNIDPEHDPDYAKERYKFCFHDEQWLKRLRNMRDGLEKISKLGRYLAEEEQQKDIIRAVEQIKKFSVAELMNTLTSAIQAKHYAKVSFSAPQIGRNLTVEFNCIDTQPVRQAYQSTRDLKRAIDKELLLTNWRLVSDGIHYRLGALSGRLKAIENPDEIKKLAEKLLQSGKIKLPKEAKQRKSNGNNPAYTEIAPDGTVIHL